MSVLHLTKDNFNEKVLKSEKPVMVDFWAAWCGPCKMIAPVIEELAAEHDDLIVAKVNVDEEGELAMKYGVMSIPTILLFKGGELVHREVGYAKKEELVRDFGL